MRPRHSVSRVLTVRRQDHEINKRLCEQPRKNSPRLVPEVTELHSTSSCRHTTAPEFLENAPGVRTEWIMEDIQWFYSKSKVPICLAITDSFDFLNKLKDACILTEEEALELQGDTRTDHRVVYECLCWIEEKNISLQHFFKFLFQESFLEKYSDLNPIFTEYKEEKYLHGIQSTTDKDKDPLIFAQIKVQISLIITDRFPFLHGLQDLTILSESESLKLQADERPVSRVIYESLSLIEKKDLKLNIVFEYIFQQCYLQLYPGLQDILQEPSGQFVGHFNGGQYPMLNIASDLLEVFEHNKMYICEAVKERFPFLHGLHDLGLLPHLQLLKLQADKKSAKEVLYEALCPIQNITDMETFFSYLFQEFYLHLYPDLHVVLQCVNAALTMEICPPSTVSCAEETAKTLEQEPTKSIAVIVKDEVNEIPVQNSSEPSSAIVKDEIREIPEQRSSEPFTDSDDNLLKPVRKCRLQLIRYSEPPDLELEVCNGVKKRKDSDDILPATVRKCRLQPISYSEPPDLIESEVQKRGKKHKAPENSKQQKSGKRKAGYINVDALRKRGLDFIKEPKPAEAPENSKQQKSGKRKAGYINVDALRKRGLDFIKEPKPAEAPENSKQQKSGKRKAGYINVDALRKRGLDFIKEPKPAEAPENSKRQKSGKRKAGYINVDALRKSGLDFIKEPKPAEAIPSSCCPDTETSTVILDYPKQVFNRKFKVQCGDKSGIFEKSHWTGNSSTDLCIRSEGKKFSVIKFEEYGGKRTSKKWKKSIECWNLDTSHSAQKKVHAMIQNAR
ncbi:uncharacterized protein LOC142749535 isoform X2 [Rhinoderma darwinii]|uniref:uncharacterized protein LOC142749535 isoform X2 n=1 Tax=Rhinoderma darwinii TaxID=43563 RepID=UPI003F664F0E